MSDFFAEFKPAYPDWKVETRLFPIESPNISGSFTLKIMLSPKCYRVINMSSGATLEDLHLAIQDVFDFDNDHLYAFYLNGRYHRSQGNMFSDPRGQFDINEYPADLFSLGEIGLYVGRSIYYLFDFGDNWEFIIEVIGTTESVEKRARKNHQLIQSVGKAPKQYRDWG